MLTFGEVRDTFLLLAGRVGEIRVRLDNDGCWYLAVLVIVILATYMHHRPVYHLLRYSPTIS